MTICLFFKKEECRRGARARRPKERLAWNCVRRARANCWKKKSNRGKTGKAYQTGFQITEVIPSVIDSPIATYRISVGLSWEGNYKGEETRREMDRGSERKRARCVGEVARERGSKQKDNGESGWRRRRKKKETVYYERSFFLPVYS